MFSLTGCFNPAFTRLPSFWTAPAEVERREYQYHDPFPDAQTGPSTGFRPTEFKDQRPMPIGIREKYDDSRARPQVGPGVPPPVGTAPGSEYPQVVPF
ncbi:MAG: hypothetical protein KDA93_15050 [Planctomycetaceae bacterium]|nr:hypothetical protein [Planctomycetaceae bacterium]